MMAKIVDLSVPLDPEYPGTWPGAMPFVHRTGNWYVETRMGPDYIPSQGTFFSRWLTMDEHCGTHFDAPAHFIPPEGSGLPHAGPLGGMTGDHVPLEWLTGPAVVIDVESLVGTTGPGVSPLITANWIAEWEARHGRIGDGDVVLLRTGWDRWYLPGPDGHHYLRSVLVDRTEPGWPAPDVSAIAWLADRRVRAVGTDAPSMGPAHDPVPTHVQALSRQMVLFECLAHLTDIPTRGATFLFLPIKLTGASGCPGRAIAFVEEVQP